VPRAYHASRGFETMRIGYWENSPPALTYRFHLKKRDARQGTSSELGIRHVIE